MYGLFSSQYDDSKSKSFAIFPTNKYSGIKFYARTIFCVNSSMSNIFDRENRSFCFDCHWSSGDMFRSGRKIW